MDRPAVTRRTFLASLVAAAVAPLVAKRLYVPRKTGTGAVIVNPTYAILNDGPCRITASEVRASGTHLNQAGHEELMRAYCLGWVPSDGWGHRA